MIYPGQNLASPVNPATQQAANATTQAGIAQMEDATRNRAIGSQERIAAMQQQGFREQRNADALAQQQKLNFEREQRNIDRQTEERLARESMKLSQAQFNAEMEYLTATTEGKIAALEKVRGIESELDALTADMLTAKAQANKSTEVAGSNLTLAANEMDRLGNQRAQLEENADEVAIQVYTDIDERVRDEIERVKREAANVRTDVGPSMQASMLMGQDPALEFVLQAGGGQIERGAFEQFLYDTLRTGAQVTNVVGLIGEQVLETVVDGLLGDDQIVNFDQAAQVKAVLDRITSPEGSREIVSRSLASAIVNASSTVSTNDGLSDQTDVLTNVIEGISSGELDEGEAISRLRAAELDPEMVGTFLYAFGKEVTPAVLSGGSLTDQATDREVGATPDVIREGSARFRLFGSKLRGLTSARYYAIRDRINANRGDLTPAFFEGLRQDDLFDLSSENFAGAESAFMESRSLQDELADMLVREGQLERRLSRAGRSEMLEAELEAIRRRQSTVNPAFEELFR